jgi:hypothetical protein
MEMGDRFEDSDFVFFTGYLMFYLVASNAQRTEIVAGDKLRLREWSNRRSGEITRDGKTYGAVIIPLTSHKTAPNVIAVGIANDVVPFFNHYFAVMRAKVTAGKSDARNAPFFVSTHGQSYAKPENAISRWLQRNQEPGDVPFQSTAIRHLAATANAKLKQVDPTR